MESNDNSSSFSSEFSIQKENHVKLGENLTIKKSILLNEKAQKSICEIIKDNGYGSGFFSKIKYEGNEIFCLFTNNHVIDEEMLLNNENIEIKINNKIYNISLKLKRRKWTDKDIDFTCIEIIEEDNIISIIDPFEIDKNNYNIEYEIKNYDKRGIVIASIGLNGEIELPQGVIYYVNNRNDYFLHNCNTDPGFSGGPIILIKNLRVIGIHCGYDEINNKNVGIYFKKIIENIERKEIKCLIDINLDKNKDGVLLFNSNEKNKEEIKDNYKVYIKDKIIEIKNIGNKYILNGGIEKMENMK